MEKRTAERENPFFFFCFSELLSRWNGTTEADLLFQKGMEKVQKYEGAESMPRGRVRLEIGIKEALILQKILWTTITVSMVMRLVLQAAINI